MSLSSLMVVALLAADPIPNGTPVSESANLAIADSAALTAAIDRLTARHWASKEIHPAEECFDADFLRRLTLDLAGRIPTAAEAQAFVADRAANKRQQAIERLMSGPEFAQHWAIVLDEAIQGKFAGEREFQLFLRKALAEGKPWDKLFAELIAGPWSDKEQQIAAAFVRKRLQNIDDLTNDTSRVFFGVEIGCAKCHDHPLVDDWKQQHYYGMQSFFNRTLEIKNKKDSKEKPIGEKDSGEVSFVDTQGKQHTAQRMFLTGEVVPDEKPQNANLDKDPRLQDRRQLAEANGEAPLANFSPRAELVKVALQQRQFFSRALVNRVWAYLLGRGLVHPVEQMHSENPPSIAGLLEILADDFADGGYRIDRLVAGIVGSRVYQLSSAWPSAAGLPNPEDFAKAPLRPLSPQQFAFSLLLATGETSLDGSDATLLARRHDELEARARGMTTLLDTRRDDYQTSAGEALYMSNNGTVQQLLQSTGKSLVARVAEAPDSGGMIDTAAWAILGRPAAADEVEFLTGWLSSREANRAAAARDLAWALLTSAEFRFNH